MKPWLTAAEIAALRLPGLPATKRNINALAASENWSERRGLCRRRAGKGGGFEFHLDLLPPEARAAYVARLARPLDTRSTPANEAEPAATSLRDDAAEARDARLAILAMAERLFAQAKLPRLHADLLCVAEYGRRALALPDWVHAQVPSLTLRSLQRWRAAAKAGRTARLAVDRGAARRGSGVLDRAEDGRVRVFVLAALVRQPHLSADHVRVLILDRFGPTLTVERAGGTSRTVPVPPVRTIQAALAKWKAAEKVRITALTNPDAYKSRYRLAGSNTASTVTRLNELWQIDASPMDALCVDGRHSVYAAIDVYSRRLVLYVSRTPRAEAVGLLLRKAILAWGVPERIKTDNGSDFTARSSERLFAALGIERELSPAFTPEAKAFVERAIGTFQRDLGPLLPGFIGHSVADRKVIEARKAFAQRLGQDDADAFCVELTGPELQAYCDAWASDRYQHRPHAGLGGATPYARATSFKGKRRDIADVRALDLLLAPVAGRDGVRTMGKQGLRIDGSLYHAPQILPETQVFVRLDPNDLGRAYLFAIDGGAYLGEAICPEILGVDPAKATAEAKRARKAFIDSGTEEIRREARRIKPRAFADAVLRQAAEGSATLVPFPRASVPHATPDLDAAAQAYRPAPSPEATFGAETRALLAEIEAELAGSIPEQSANVTPLRAVETRQQRFRRAQEIQARMKSGVEVSPTEAFWLGSYVQGSEYDAMHKLFEDFGESALL